MTSIAVNKDEFIKRCEEVYERNKDRLERQHYGRLVALWEDGVASVADTVDDAFKEAEKKLPDKIFYVRRVGKYSAAGILFQATSMLFKYKENLPIVGIKVYGNLGEKEFEAHIDFASSLTTLPYRATEELGLEFKGFVPIATGGGVISLPTYRGKVKAFNREFDLRIGALDLPEETKIKALVGRDILDQYKVCLDGKRKEFEVSDP